MLLYIIIIVIGVIIDQISKSVAVLALSDVSTIPIIPNVFHLTYVENTGAAFSLFEDMQIFLILITSAFIFALGYLLYILPKTKHYRLSCFALSLMISGALGNLIDRIRLSYVVDFFDFRIIGFAIFNVADTLVVCGTILLAYALLKNKNLFNEPPFVKKPSKAVSSDPGMHKDVLKDLKKTETPVQDDVDITPKVKTNLKRLPSRQPVSFKPTPSLDFEEEIKIYTPRAERERIIIESSAPKEVEPAPVAKKRRSNRYNDRSSQYEETVKRQRLATNRAPASRNRYNERTDHYEETIRLARSEFTRQKKVQSEWNPHSEPAKKKTQASLEPSIWETGEIPKIQRNTDTRYDDMVDSYQALVNKTERAKIVREETSPDWENPKPKRKNNTRPKKRKVDTVITDTKPVRSNRYTDSSDSYLRSIEEAAKKQYTDKK